jgi:RNase P/RNase MRP subunit p29
MHKHTKGEDGKYHINGHTYEQLIGSRAQVWHGTAFKTKSGLVKHKLVKNKRGRIVSESKRKLALKNKTLVKHGFVPKKGTFKLFHKSDGNKKITQKHKRSNKKRTMKHKK